MAAGTPVLDNSVLGYSSPLGVVLQLEVMPAVAGAGRRDDHTVPDGGMLANTVAWTDKPVEGVAEVGVEELLAADVAIPSSVKSGKIVRDGRPRSKCQNCAYMGAPITVISVESGIICRSLARSSRSLSRLVPVGSGLWGLRIS